MTSAAHDAPPPPEPSAIDFLPRFPDGRDLHLSIAELRLRIRSLEPGLAEAMAGRLGPFAAEAGEPVLDVTAHDAGREHFLAPPPGTADRVYRMVTAYGDGCLRMAAHGFAGWLRPSEGKGAVALCRGSFDPPERALENFLRVAVAWSALEMGGLLIHSASIVRNDLAYLFFGASGAGKSTLAAMSEQGCVVSDDLTVVLPGAGGRLEVAGSPFRGTYTGGEPVFGRYPIHSAYRLKQDQQTFVARQAPSIAAVELLSNLTFVVDRMADVRGLPERIDALLRRIPTFRLHFRKDTDFWRAVDGYHAGHP